MTGSNSFKQILKNTSILGVVQVIQILSTLVRGKMISVFMGAAGLGVFNFCNSFLLILTQISSLGLSYVIVKETSKIDLSIERLELSKLLGLIRFWSVISCIVGLIIVPSVFYFLPNKNIVNSNFITPIILSFTVICTILANNYTAILQGSKQMKQLALSNALPALISLIVIIPVYKVYRINGILLGFLIFSFLNVIITYFYCKKLPFQKISTSVAFTKGKPMILLGLSMMLTLLFSSISTFLINSFIAKYGSINDLGYYGAAIALTSQYIGLLFSAMALDYFPRLSQICDNKTLLQDVVNEQLEVVLLLVLPLTCVLISCAKPLILLLLTKEFYVIVDVVNWLAVSLFFKAIAFPFGYISFAKGDRKVFFFLEGVLNSIFLMLFTVLGYYLFGLVGVGYAVLLFNLLYFLLIYTIAVRRYSVKMTSKNLKKVIIYTLLLGGIFLLLKTNFLNYGYLFTYTFAIAIVMINGRKFLINLR